jgi:tetratricopeptide (TPR) repeat protein
LSKPSPGNRSEAQRAFDAGVQAQTTGHPGEAVQDYQRATRLDGTFYEAYFNLALALSASGSLRSALNAYENALAVRPDSADARYNFALALQQSNFPLDAANEFETLLSQHPAETRAHLALANLYAQQLHDSTRARPHYLKVLANDPRNPQAGQIRSWLAGNP